MDIDKIQRDVNRLDRLEEKVDEIRFSLDSMIEKLHL